MSQDTVEFPWRSPYETHSDTAAPVEVIASPKGAEKWRRWIKKHRALVVIVVASGALILALEQKKADGLATVPNLHNAQLSIMVPIVPFAKGAVIEARMLKPVVAPIRSFTKTQLLSVFTEEDVERIDDRIVAKKDLPPYRPIFWPSLELRPHPPAQIKRIEVLYPNDGAKQP